MANTQSTVVLFAALSGVFFGILALAQRWALKGKSGPVRFNAWLFATQAGLLACVYVARWGFNLPLHLHEGFWRPIAGSVILNIGISYCSAKAMTYRAGEVSKVAPLAAMTPFFLTLLATTLGEYPGLWGWAGIMLLVAASWVFLYREKPRHWWEWVGPLYRLGLIFRWPALSLEAKEEAIVVWLALAGATLSSFALLCDGLYARRGGDLQGLWFGYALTIAFLGVWWIAVYGVQRYRTAAAAEEWRGEQGKFFTAVVVAAASTLLLMWTLNPFFQETYVGYVGALSRLRILAPVVLVWGLSKIPAAKNIFGEEDLKKRFIITVVMVLGAMLIASEELPQKLTDRIVGSGF